MNLKLIFKLISSQGSNDLEKYILDPYLASQAPTSKLSAMLRFQNRTALLNISCDGEEHIVSSICPLDSRSPLHSNVFSPN